MSPVAESKPKYIKVSIFIPQKFSETALLSQI